MERFPAIRRDPHHALFKRWLRSHLDLPMRERQIMEILYRRYGATAREVLNDLPRGPSYSAVRSMLTRLADREYVWVTQRRRALVYVPVTPLAEVQLASLRQLLNGLFAGSAATMRAMLLEIVEASPQPVATE